MGETFLLENHKGQRPIERPRQQVPILVATDRSGSTISYCLPVLNTANLKRVLR